MMRTDLVSWEYEKYNVMYEMRRKVKVKVESLPIFNLLPLRTRYKCNTSKQLMNNSLFLNGKVTPHDLWPHSVTPKRKAVTWARGPGAQVEEGGCQGQREGEWRDMRPLIDRSNSSPIYDWDRNKGWCREKEKQREEKKEKQRKTGLHVRRLTFRFRISTVILQQWFITKHDIGSVMYSGLHKYSLPWTFPYPYCMLLQPRTEMDLCVIKCHSFASNIKVGLSLV